MHQSNTNLSFKENLFYIFSLEIKFFFGMIGQLSSHKYGKMYKIVGFMLIYIEKSDLNTQTLSRIDLDITKKNTFKIQE